MKKFVLTTDSGMCANKENNPIVIPAQIVASNGISYCDNGELSNEQILRNMKNDIIYKTSSPLLGDYIDTFRKILEDGKDVIHLSMSSGISSGSVNAANITAIDLNDEYENQVYVIDSLTAASGGTLFYELAYDEIINNPCSTKEMVERLNKLKQYIQTAFYVPNIDGYIRSGRDKSSSDMKSKIFYATSHLAKRAAIKFRVDFNENGELHLKKLFRASDEKGMEKMVMDIINEKNIETFDPRLVVIGNLFKEKINMKEVKEYLASFNYFERILENKIGSVVAAYGCNDLCGISLVKKKF